MNRAPLTRIAPEIFRKRLLIEGYFDVTIDERVLLDWFLHITTTLGLRTYADPIVHATGGEGKSVNQGYDGFVPLIDSGIYIAVWSAPRFLSTVIYTCAAFDENQAVAIVQDYFRLREYEAAIF